MSTRFEDLMDFGILSYLHLPEAPALKETSEYLRSCVNHASLTFYGMTEPVCYPPFVYDLLSQQYDALETRLQRGEDQHVESPYASRNEKGEWVNSMYRATTYNKAWCGFTLMEMAYMLGDFTAYQLLKKYGRTTAHIIGDWNTTYGDWTIHMLTLHDEPKKIEKLMALR